MPPSPASKGAESLHARPRSLPAHEPFSPHSQHQSVSTVLLLLGSRTFHISLSLYSYPFFPLAMASLLSASQFRHHRLRLSSAGHTGSTQDSQLPCLLSSKMPETMGTTVTATASGGDRSLKRYINCKTISTFYRNVNVANKMSKVLVYQCIFFFSSVSIFTFSLLQRWRYYNIQL